MCESTKAIIVELIQTAALIDSMNLPSDEVSKKLHAQLEEHIEFLVAKRVHSGYLKIKDSFLNGGENEPTT